MDDIRINKEFEIACAIEEFKREKNTGRLEIHFKQGELVGGHKYVSLFK